MDLLTTTGQPSRDPAPDTEPTPHGFSPPTPSLLFAPGASIPDALPGRDFRTDLNIDQVLTAITSGRDEYGLLPYFLAPLRTVDAIRYRQDVFRDLVDMPLLGRVTRFASHMTTARDYSRYGSSSRYHYQQLRWHLDAARSYCDVVIEITDALEAEAPRSLGMRLVHEALATYRASSTFTGLRDDALSVKHELDEIKYCVHLQGLHVQVSRFEDRDDYSEKVLATFARFAQSSPSKRGTTEYEGGGLDHVEARILDLVAALLPEPFAALDEFCTKHAEFVSPLVAGLDREAQFYVAYIELMRRVQDAGLEFCMPEVSSSSKEVRAQETYDLALASQFVGERREVVPNSFALLDPERILVVTGPNQGGKTTFARTFGQLHYFACLGCPVPGRAARLFAFDRLFTHFERAESVTSLRGKLQDELVRMHGILAEATPSSIVILNEIFTSTTLEDAVLLGSNVLGEIMRLDALCVCVTFVDELSRLSEKTVSVVSITNPANPAESTFKIVRRAADGLSHAMALADRYGLTYERLRARVLP